MNNKPLSYSTGPIRWFLSCLFSLSLLLAQAWAQNPAGSLAGKVSDASNGAPLVGAIVNVDDTKLQTTSDREGDFYFGNLTPGTHIVRVSYLGMDVKTTSIEITAGQRASLTVQLGEKIVTLEALKVTSQREGQARALNQQRAADTLTNIVASDAVGKFPDQNAAEALTRIAGVALYRDQGEGRFVIIRGINSQYNGVSINGFRAATSEKGTRTVPLDNVASESIASLEVSKVAMPDKDADGLGGSVDVKTRTAFDYNRQVSSLDAGWLYSNQEGRQGQKIGGMWGDVFLNNKLGVLAAVSYQKRPYSSFNVEGDSQWTQKTSPSDGQQRWLFNEADFRHYEPTRTRTSGNFSFDYRPDDTALIYLRGIFTLFDDREHRWMTSIPFSSGTLTALTDTSASANGVTTTLRDRERDEIHRLGSIVLGWEKTLASWKLDGGLSVNYGNEGRTAGELYFTTINPGNFTYNITDYTNVNVVQTGGASNADPANYKFSNKSTNTYQTGSESLVALRQNARYDFEIGDKLPAYFKFGGVYSHKTKKEDYFTVLYSAVPFTISSALVPDTVYPLYSGLKIDSGYTDLIYNSPTSAFPNTRSIAKDIPADFDAKENVAAGYAMGGVTVDKLKIMGGVRAEYTQFDISGFQLLNGSTITPVSASQTYDNWTPGIYLNYDLTKKMILRASWSNTLSRPPFESMMIGRVVDDSKKTVAQGNPYLKTLTSQNWDASFEYYLSSLGMIAVSPFYKQIKNFTYQSSTGIDATTGYPLTTFMNGPSASIKGIELTWQQKLSFLPDPLKGFGFAANATFSDSEASYPTRPGETLSFIGQSKRIGNLALNYERGGFFAQVSLSYHSPRLRVDEAIGANATLDPYEDSYTSWDAQVNYRFKKNWEVYVNLVNLSDEPFQTYFNGSSGKRLEQYERYGWSTLAGIRWNL